MNPIEITSANGGAFCDSSSTSSTSQNKIKLYPNQDKKAKDNMLDRLAVQTLDQKTIWLSQEEQKAAEKISKKIDKIHGSKERIAVVSGLLAGVASGCGCVPLVGGLVGAPFGLAANYYGASAGIDLGFDYAEQCDLRQDLYNDTKTLYASLAIRLLDRYIKAFRVDMAQQLEAPYAFKFSVLSPEKKARLAVKKAQLQELSKNILNHLAHLEKEAVETLWGGPLYTRTVEEQKKQKPVKLSKNQRQIQKFKKEIQNITTPLKEVCEYIQGTRLGFSVPVLHNERDTMMVRYNDKLTAILRIKVDENHAAETAALRTKMAALEKENKKLKHQCTKQQSNYKALLKRVEKLENYPSI